MKSAVRAGLRLFLSALVPCSMQTQVASCELIQQAAVCTFII